MTEQHYRVIADRDKGDDPEIDRDYREGDRLVFENWDIGYDDGRQVGTLVRIERPVPTACTCPPSATHMEDGPDQDCPKHGDRVSLPLVHIVSPRASGKRSALLDAVLDRADERGIQVQVVPSPSLPTREQIAEAMRPEIATYEAVAHGSDEALYTSDSDMPERIADAVLALLQKGADRG